MASKSMFLCVLLLNLLFVAENTGGTLGAARETGRIQRSSPSLA